MNIALDSAQTRDTLAENNAQIALSERCSTQDIPRCLQTPGTTARLPHVGQIIICLKIISPQCINPDHDPDQVVPVSDLLVPIAPDVKHAEEREGYALALLTPRSYISCFLPSRFESLL